jgi:protein-L-isoaspartate(D-aspartate) O-methyltransferase
VVPDALLEQLAEGGIMVIPVGNRAKQVMLRITKKNGKLSKEEFEYFSFVPLLGDQGWNS